MTATLLEEAPRRAALPDIPDKPTIRQRITGWFGTTRIYDFPIQTDQIAGPLQFTTDGVLAWFVLAPLNWEFKDKGEREQLWDVMSAKLGLIATSLDVDKRPVHIRRSTQPYAAYEWAARMAAESTPIPDVTGAPSFEDYLVYAQQQLGSGSLEQKMATIGIWIGDPPCDDAKRDLIEGAETPHEEAELIIDRLRELETIISGAAFDGRLATAADMAFLMHRSMSVGMPAPMNTNIGASRWSANELGQFVDRREWLTSPYAPSVEVVGEIEGAPARRHVVVVSLGATPDLTWPDSGADAWMALGDRLNFPVEWSLNGYFISGRKLEAKAVTELHMINNIVKHYEEHRMPVPDEIMESRTAAKQTLRQITQGDIRDAPRFVGTVRVAVYADTRAEAIKRARKFRHHYAEHAHFPWSNTHYQGRMLREFVPGEPRLEQGWERRFNVAFLGAAMPHIASHVGTEDGPYIGHAVLSRRAWLSNLHAGPENNRSGLMTVSCAQGGGKSMMLGCYAHPATILGELSVIVDPSGPLGGMARWPELAPNAEEKNLAEAPEGTLAPWRLVPTPQKEHYLNADGVLNEIGYDNALKSAKSERTQLMSDVLRMFLSSRLLRTHNVDDLLSEALWHLQEEHHIATRIDPTMWNPRWIIEFLEKSSDPAARPLVRELRTAAEFTLGSLIIPEHSDPIADLPSENKLLTIITMPGLEPPPETSDRDTWGVKERQTQPMLHLAAYLASKIIYGQSDRSLRKNVFLDESHVLSRWPSGRALLLRLSRDSRKWNTAILACSQDPADHLAIGKLDALTGGCFVGRLPSIEAAQRGCQALGISPKHAPAFLDLEDGQFVHMDAERRVALVQVDASWHPSHERLKTTPGRHKRSLYTGKLAPAPLIDDRLLSDLEAQVLAA